MLKNGYMKDSFTLEVVSIHVDSDVGNKENVSFFFNSCHDALRLKGDIRCMG